MNTCPAAEIEALNLALAGELQLIAAYDFGEETHLLQPEALELARIYRCHHEQHAALLADAIRALGGTPIEAPESYDFAGEGLSGEQDMLELAARLEQRAAGSSLKALPRLPGHPAIANAAASILGNDAMHHAVLQQALGGRPVFMA